MRFTSWMTEARLGFKVPPHLAATACCSPFVAGIVPAGARGVNLVMEQAGIQVAEGVAPAA